MFFDPRGDTVLSIEDAFSAPGPDDGSTDGLKIMLDHITVEDAAVRIWAGAGAAVHVTQATVRVTHDLSLTEQGVRPTDVILSDVCGNFHADGYESISGVDVRAIGPIFDMRMRVCHPQGVVALRVRLDGEAGSPALRPAAGLTRLTPVRDDFAPTRARARLLLPNGKIQLPNREPYALSSRSGISR